MRRTIQLTGVDGASGVGTFSCNLPMSLDYFAFYAIDLNAVALLANMPNINLYANGDYLRNYTGVQQGILNTVDKLPAYSTDSCLSIHLDLTGMKTVQATYGSTLNTLSPDPITKKSITTARLEIITNAGSAPNWQLFADVDDAGAGGPGILERIKVFGNIGLGTSEKSLATVFPFGTPDVRWWRRLLVANLSTGTITLGRLLRGSASAEVFKRTLAVDQHIVNDYNIRAVAGTASATSCAFLLDGTETGIPETWDTMTPNPAWVPDVLNPDGSVKTKGNGDTVPNFISVGTMDPRFTASATSTADFIHSTQGSL